MQFVRAIYHGCPNKTFMGVQIKCPEIQFLREIYHGCPNKTLMGVQIKCPEFSGEFIMGVLIKCTYKMQWVSK